jgi:hypothetical protein
MATTRELLFHSDFARVTVVCNGVPLSLNTEVEITIKRPTKLDGFSARAWNQLSAATADEITAERIPGTRKD